MRSLVVSALLGWLPVVGCAVASAAEPASAPIPGLGPSGPIQKLHEGLVFTEGPATDAQGQLYFTDVPRELILKSTAAKPAMVRRDSGHANGMMFNRAGELVACVMDGRIETISPTDGKTLRVLAEGYQGQRFNAPNDLVIDAHGGVYFTDPLFSAPRPLPQGVQGVYYLAADGRVSRLVDDLPAPNGVILSPDEKTLYVIPSGQAEMMAYPVESPGKLGAGRVFCTLAQPAGQTKSGGDGLTVDERGNLYITSAQGLQVFDPAGKALGIIALGAQPSNCTFGGPDGKTLYVTARSLVFAVPMDVAGHRFATAAP